ncbi:hypothetical protein [Bacillus sp. MRMR6]|uniref:hypothetical protein n=1 Tax=Bacillus sp. MRMR6 TaxID=1928617 RepID=UPI000951A4D9|nr:hypothetical protein [Bacillus sp. MRMR6]OLS33381.1 hypothetical protein BTR25_26150 [Bacillus sp. MRMR6]
MKPNIKTILAPMSTKERISYIWDYYRFHIMGTIAAIILVIFLIGSVGEKKETYLNLTIMGTGLNTNHIVQIQEDLTNKLVTDKDHEEVLVQSINYGQSSMDPASQVGIQKFTAEVSSGDIDVLIVQYEFFEKLSTQEALIDLDELGVNFRDETVIKTGENVYGIDASDIELLKPLQLDGNMVICVLRNTKNLDNITQFFTLITE